MRDTGSAVLGRTLTIGLFILLTVIMLLWATTAYAQSAEDQYGSPTESANVVSDALGVLPDTGGPLVLFAGGALIVAGSGVALLRRRVGGR